MNKDLFRLLLALLLSSLLAACGGGGAENPAPPSSAKEITGFIFTSPSATGAIDEGAKTISVTVPYGTDVTGLVATFTTSGASVKVGATTQVSATTPNDFTNPVVYTVTAADSSTATYTVTVTAAPAPSQLVLYDFEGSVSTPQSVDVHLTASDFTASGTVTYPTGNGSTSAIMQNTWDGALGTTYFEFTVTPLAGYDLLPTQLSFDSMRSSTGPTNWQVLVDPGTGWVEVGSGVTAPALTWGTTTLDLSGYGPYIGSVSFRITATGASASGGTWRLDNVSLVGYVEPL